MTAVAIAHRQPSRLVVVSVGLGLILAGRWMATNSGLLDPVSVGIGFGAALLGLAVVGGWRTSAPRRSSLLAGVAGGAVLIALAVLIRWQGLEWRFATPFVPWALATVLVATAEEAVLRGALFDAITEWASPLAAVVVTSLTFALMHVPFYDWHVVPLDLGVGLFLAGLRLTTGGIAAPAVAHVLADLAVYWL